MISTSVYVFGDLGVGYSQYPDNYSRDIFPNFYTQASAKSQIVVHRDGGLMYYGYIRKLDTAPQYIGFCMLLNDAMFSDVGVLFPIFENAVAEMVLQGEILAFNEDGDIVCAGKDLVQCQQEVGRVSAMISNAIDSLNGKIEMLPPVDNSKSNTDKKQFCVADDNAAIAEASVSYAYTCVAKNKGCNTSSLSGYKGVIRKLSKEKAELSLRYGELKHEYDKLNGLKKQYSKVVVLCVFVLLCGFGLLFLKENLNSTERNLQQEQHESAMKSNTISKQNDTIESLRINVAGLDLLLSDERKQRKGVENRLRQMTKKYNQLAEKYHRLVEMHDNERP